MMSFEGSNRDVEEREKKTNERDAFLSDLPDDLPMIFLNVRDIVRGLLVCSSHSDEQRSAWAASSLD